MKSGVTVYGADWCGDTQRTRRHLDDLGVNYSYVNIDHDGEAEEMVLEQNEGRRRIPLVLIGDDTVLRVPEPTELDEALAEAGLLASSQPDGSAAA